MSDKRSEAAPCVVDPGRLHWVGPLAVLSSVASVLCVRYIGVALVQPDRRFLPLTVTPAVIDTIVFVTFAIFVFARVISGGNIPGILLRIVGLRFFTLEPIQAFRLLAFRVLLVSFLPDVVLSFSPRAKWSYGLVLAAMHVGAWAACVPVLTNLTITRGKKTSSSRENPESE